MLREIPLSVFDNWFSHYMKEPWGYEFEIHRHAEICTYLVNGLFNPKSPAKPSDFYPKKEAESDNEKTGDEIEALLRNRFGG